MALMTCSCQLTEQTGLLGCSAAGEELNQGALFPLQTCFHPLSERGKKSYEDYLARS